MSIPETISFDNTGQAIGKPSLVRRFFLALLILLVAFLAFGLGRLTAGEGSGPVRVEYDTQALQAAPLTAPVVQAHNALQPAGEPGQEVYASSKGKRYYYANCSGLSRISAANKVTFPSAAAAEASGLTLAANCSPN